MYHASRVPSKFIMFCNCRERRRKVVIERSQGCQGRKKNGGRNGGAKDKSKGKFATLPQLRGQRREVSVEGSASKGQRRKVSFEMSASRRQHREVSVEMSASRCQHREVSVQMSASRVRVETPGRNMSLAEVEELQRPPQPPIREKLEITCQSVWGLLPRLLPWIHSVQDDFSPTQLALFACYVDMAEKTDEPQAHCYALIPPRLTDGVAGIGLARFCGNEDDEEGHAVPALERLVQDVAVGLSAEPPSHTHLLL
ncbi:hypothetical protein EYF80_023489 [Liparis tanakae]|uniref:Uncharacterized protein n=1 Tax=Liparis tanakae TaxID=230148 RepID=A0A4Z2HLU1_9TELE|nr:hypothetical protein EYF80_023489 [Liparis tanakae]